MRLWSPLVSVAFGLVLAGAAGAQRMDHEWTRQVAGKGSYDFRSACASASGQFLMILAKRPPRPEPLTHVAMVLDRWGNVLQEIEPAIPGQHIADIAACIGTKDGYLLTARLERGELQAVWLSAELEPQSALPLVGRESAQVWALTQGDDDRFVAALDVDWKPSLLFFDRKTVVRVTPAWSGDKARLLFDVATVDERVVVCGLEGDVGGNPRDPSFAGHQVLVASFGYDGSERASMRLPGRTCRLFSEGEGVVLFHQNSDDPRSGLRLTRLDKELRESDRRSALDRIAFLFKLEAERVGQSFVVLRNELGAPALDFIQDDDIHSMKLDPQIERPTAIRAVGDRVVVFSYDLRDSGESGVRVDSFVAGR